MKPVGVIISTAFLFLVLGSAVPVCAQHEQGENQKPAKPEQQQAKPAPQQQAKPAPQQQQHTQQQQQAKPAPQQQQHAQQQQQAKPAPQQQAKPAPQQQQHAQQQKRPPQQQARLPQPRQQQLISEQQQRVTQYRQHLDSQQRLAVQSGTQLQQQKRTAEYSFQQQYVAHVRQQQVALQRTHDYNNDPYYYTAPIYRYNRGGSYYETNEYGAKVLSQAVNYGYAQGFRAGRAARQDRWTSGYQSSYAYQDANYGYDGYYVDQADYNYYFREGFSRGYEDGYNSRYRYGRYSGGSYSILGGILSTILNLQPLG